MAFGDLHKIEKPREKLEKYGPEKLTEVELLAILLRTGIKGLDVLTFSKNILKKCSDRSIFNASFEQLTSINGLGPAKAAEIIACFELGRRFLKKEERSLILKPEDVWERLSDIRSKMKEYFVVFYLDTRCQEIKREIVSVGILNLTLIHPREVFELAVKKTAASILVAHNHPSGELHPSDDDIKTTKRLKSAGDILGIELIDHVIVSKEGHISMKKEGYF